MYYQQTPSDEASVPEQGKTQDLGQALLVLARVFAEGPMPSLGFLMNAMPDLRSYFAENFSTIGSDYTECFVLNAPPVRSLYLGDQEVLDLKFESKIVSKVPANHLSVYLEQITLNLLHDEKVNEEILADLQQWLLPFAQAVVGMGNPFASALVTLTLELLQCIATTPPSPKQESIPELTDLAPESLAELLADANRCGKQLTLKSIRKIAADLDLPCGFTSRKAMLTNLINSALHYDKTTTLAQTLSDEFVRANDWYKTWSECFHASQWIARSKRTQKVLDQWHRSIEEHQP